MSRGAARGGTPVIVRRAIHERSGRTRAILRPHILERQPRTYSSHVGMMADTGIDGASPRRGQEPDDARSRPARSPGTVRDVAIETGATGAAPAEDSALTLASQPTTSGDGSASSERDVPGDLEVERLIAYLAMAAAVVFNLEFLQAEVRFPVPRLNDEVLHLIATRQAVRALSSGHDPTDTWLATIGMGYALFRHYQ